MERITSLTALLVLPWVMKVAWAPLIDRFGRSQWGFRSCILISQLIMGFALLPLLWLTPGIHFHWWSGLLLLHAFAAATQDVAIDAMAINCVPEDERGRINGCMQAGMLLGRSLFGGMAIVIGARFGWTWIIAALILCIWASLLLLLRNRETGNSISPTHQPVNLVAIFTNRRMWQGLGFALLAGAGFESTGVLAGPYLIDLGASADAVGIFYGLPVVAATLVGGLLGGFFSDRFDVRRGVALSLTGWVMMIGALSFAHLSAPGEVRLAIPFGLLTGMYFFVGSFTVSSYALYMKLTDKSAAATQFSAFMAATNGCESWSGWAGGQLSGLFGYATSFAALAVVSLASLRLLPNPGLDRENSSVNQTT